jgi:hypothetical protein
MISECCESPASKKWDQLVGVAGLGQEAEDVAMIDGLHGRLQIMVAGQHHPDAVRGDAQGLAQELDAIHLGHPHVGDDHGEGAVIAQQRETLGARLCRGDLETLARATLVGVERVLLIVDEEDPFGHRSALLAWLPPGRRGEALVDFGRPGHRLELQSLRGG